MDLARFAWFERGSLIAAMGIVAAGLLAATALHAAPARNPDGVAVIIGNKAYTHERVAEVSFAHRDADAFRRYVVDVLGFDAANIIDLRDATQAQMSATFGNERSHQGNLWSFLSPSGQSDVVVFYSGHGVPGQRDGRGYLLPANADPNVAEINGYPIDLLYENLGKLKEAKSIRVFLDACFSGDSHRGMLIRSASPVFVKAALPKAAGKMTVLTAASGQQLASWDETAKHGLFTHHLLDALYGKADANGDGTVTAREAKAWLDRHMTRAARRTLKRNQIASLNGAADTALSTATGKAFSERPMTLAARSPSPDLTGLRPMPEEQNNPFADLIPVNIEKVLNLSRGDRILIQRGLNGLKLEAGPADGLYGPKTRQAIRSWQSAKGFKATGYLTRDQASALIVSGREVKVAVGVFPGAPPVTPAPAPLPSNPKPGTVFRDCADCPEMVVIPSGSFRMGDLSGDGRDNEKPVRRVTIARAFAAGKFEVTFAEWDACVLAGGCSHRPGDEGWGRGSRPVINVSWDDTQAYIKWLSGKTGQRYRLLSESEWEYAARAGSSTEYPFGDSESGLCGYGNVADGTSKSTYGDWTVAPCSDGHVHTAPVGSFRANRFGLHDTVGNVWEWVGDCWNGSYEGAPSDGSMRTSGDCSRRVLRGGSWGSVPRDVRSAIRSGNQSGNRYVNFGFRLARTL